MERQVDHEAEKGERERQKHRKKREVANRLRNEELLLARQRKADAEARDYARLNAGNGSQDYEQEQWEASQRLGEVRPVLSLLSHLSHPRLTVPCRLSTV